MNKINEIKIKFKLKNPHLKIRFPFVSAFQALIKAWSPTIPRSST
jgi:hypothetical protein